MAFSVNHFYSYANHERIFWRASGARNSQKLSWVFNWNSLGRNAESRSLNGWRFRGESTTRSIQIETFTSVPLNSQFKANNQKILIITRSPIASRRCQTSRLLFTFCMQTFYSPRGSPVVVIWLGNLFHLFSSSMWIAMRWCVKSFARG